MSEESKCVCRGNWRAIVDEYRDLIDKRFFNVETGETSVFFGIVWGSDDFYFGMYDPNNKLHLLSCVCDLKTHGYELEGDQSPSDMLDYIQMRQSELETDKHDILFSVWPDFSPIEHVVPMVWECPESPFGHCAYHKFEDPAWDDCIFCHKPYER
jgi:hypothetical protein